MKPLMIAAALLLVPAAAHAQVAAGTMPNTFDRPAAQPPARPAPSPVSTTRANPQSEAALRAYIAGAQAGRVDYSVMSTDLASQLRGREAEMRPVLQRLGALQGLEFVGSRDGLDLFAAVFANGRTQWMVGFNDADKVDALLFRTDDQ
jgi:hypothetical protein